MIQRLELEGLNLFSWSPQKNQFELPKGQAVIWATEQAFHVGQPGWQWTEGHKHHGTNVRTKSRNSSAAWDFQQLNSSRLQRLLLLISELNRKKPPRQVFEIILHAKACSMNLSTWTK